MAKQYKIWMHIESYDSKTQEYADACDPISLGEDLYFNDLESAQIAATITIQAGEFALSAPQIVIPQTIVGEEIHDAKSK